MSYYNLHCSLITHKQTCPSPTKFHGSETQLSGILVMSNRLPSCPCTAMPCKMSLLRWYDLHEHTANATSDPFECGKPFSPWTQLVVYALTYKPRCQRNGLPQLLLLLNPVRPPSVQTLGQTQHGLEQAGFNKARVMRSIEARCKGGTAHGHLGCQLHCSHDCHQGP